MNLIQQLLLVCPLVFFAGFVDSIAGGGGIISLPAYHIAGLPPTMALGTNKFSSTFGTSISTFRFVRNGKIHVKAAIVSVTTAFIGSALGALLAGYVSDVILKYFLIIMLPVLAVFVLKNKKFNENGFEIPLTLSKTLLLAALAGFVIGCYDGFFGPGTGTFLILIFNTIIGFDLLTSSGNAKVINLSSNIAALATFLLSGNVVIAIGIPAAICGIAGNYLGSGLALKNGIKIIRPVFIVVVGLLLAKVCFDLFTTING